MEWRRRGNHHPEKHQNTDHVLLGILGLFEEVFTDSNTAETG
jgi:hypothetical protein